MNGINNMNANELADAMMTIEKPHPTWTKAANMLRQQQVEIEMLRNQLWDLKSEPWGFDKGAQKNESK